MRLSVKSLTQTVTGQEIFFWYPEAVENEKSPLDLLLIGGVHGNEPEGVVLCKSVIAALQKAALDLVWGAIPEFNPDGLIEGSRLNANQVDLNRNLPTKDWSPEAFNPKYPPGEFANSEPENQALVRLIEAAQPKLIISFHSFERTLLNINGDCRAWAQVISEEVHYEIEESIGYPTPGCLGTYAGLERPHPTITYELKRGLSVAKIIQVHRPAVMKSLKLFTKTRKRG